MEKEIKKLVNELNAYRQKYYNAEETGISDEEFDFKERRLKKLDPNNEYFYQVGVKTQTRDTPVEHKYPMLSMQKVQNAEEAINWFFDLQNKFPELHFNNGIPSLWYEPKFDGISGKIVYGPDGKYKLASTRGDGTTGALIPFGSKINGVLPEFVPNSELCGEFIISKRYSKQFDGPLRNTCSGILKRKEETEELKYVDFVTFDVRYYDNNRRSTFNNRFEKLVTIKEYAIDNGTEPILFLPKQTVNIPQIYDDYVHTLRDNCPYETDGLILTIDGGQDNYDLINSKYIISSYNRYNMALKPPAEFGSSEIIDIIGVTNRIKISFVAKIKPIIINGVTIQRATLDNYQTVKRLKVGIGTTVLIKRSNDVIPKIVEAYNEKGKDIKFLDFTKCLGCGSPVVKIYQDIMCPNEYGCVDIYSSKIEDFLRGLGVKNVGSSIVGKLAEYIYSNKKPLTFSSVLTLLTNSNELMAFLNYGYNGSEKRANTFISSIQHLFDTITELKLLANFSIPYIGESSLIKAGLTTVKKFLDYKKYLDTLKVVEDSFDIRLINWFKEQKHIDDILSCYKILRPYFKEIKEKSGTEITYCISGEVPGFKNKKELIDKLTSINPDLTYSPSVSSSLNYLVSIETNTTKVLKAMKYKIPILSPSTIIDKFSK